MSLTTLKNLASLSRDFSKAVLELSDNDQGFSAEWCQQLRAQIERQQAGISKIELTNVAGLSEDDVRAIELAEDDALALLKIRDTSETKVLLKSGTQTQETSGDFANINAKELAKLFAPQP